MQKYLSWIHMEGQRQRGAGTLHMLCHFAYTYTPVFSNGTLCNALRCPRQPRPGARPGAPAPPLAQAVGTGGAAAIVSVYSVVVYSCSLVCPEGFGQAPTLHWNRPAWLGRWTPLLRPERRRPRPLLPPVLPRGHCHPSAY